MDNSASREGKAYRHFGVMLDCSRNAIMRVDEVKNFIDIIAKMGYNTLLLYAEDTYLLEDEPYFGYLRGGYTGGEIREIDAYAKEKSVELIPCIQTLAHFTNLVKLPCYKDTIDVNDILLIDEEKTYELIEKIIANAAKCFTSRSINIGMDEAHLVGRGKYFDLHGDNDRFTLLTRHLSRVAAIAQKYGFVSSMWSDMFFRFINDGDYYGTGLHIPKEVVDRIPENVELAYWDYYNTDTELIGAMLDSHVETGRRTWFAGGAWTWNGFAPMNGYSLLTMRPAMECVAKSKIEDVVITMWGDNGKECSFYAVLPSLYAIRRYADGEFDDKKIKREFTELFGVAYDDFMLLDLPNQSKRVREDGVVENPCKSLLYNDPFLGLYDKAMEKEGKIDFGEYADKLFSAMKRVGEYGYIFQTLGALCKVMQIKATLGIRTRKAYKKKKKDELIAIADDYYECVSRLKDFYECFRALWHKENKGFGFEIQDVRLGGLIWRLKSCRERILAYAAGNMPQIEELETEVLPYPPSHESALQNNLYARIISPSEL